MFKGYVPTKNKKCLLPYKDVPSDKLMTYEQVKDLDEFAGILEDDIILIDVDDKSQSDILMNIVEDLQLNCRVYQTTRGRHFLFKNDKVDKCGTKVKSAIGISIDVKVGSKNSYEIIKIDGEERFIEWDVEDSKQYDAIPKWLTVVKFAPDFLTMGDGDGRNQELFNYILNLQSNGFTKDECRECIRLINKYVLAKPLPDGELDTILRDDAFKQDIFFNGKAFLFDKFAQYLKNEHHLVKINGQIHIYNNGVYDYSQKIIESKMIEKIPTLTAQRRTEVMKYLDLICENIEQSEANYIAFKNGIYDIVTDTLVPYTPDIILTNRINHNYNPDAYNQLADNTLDKLACNDKEVRALLEECIGYCFYRRNELGKAFILTGDKSNGKSTFLDLIKCILGDNTSALDLRELGDRFSTAMLFGKLANIGDDIGDEFMQGNAVSIFKKIVTGNRVKAEMKGKDPFEFNPYVKLLFSANDMPRMRDKTGAVLRRLVMIPFNATFSKDDADYDPFIKYKLITEDSIEYLIQLGIEGLKRVLTNNEFTKSSKVTTALTEYEEENNPIIAFVNEVGEDRILNQPTHDVYLRYTVFCSQNQLQALSKIAFSKQINKRLNCTTLNQRVNGDVVRIFKGVGR